MPSIAVKGRSLYFEQMGEAGEPLVFLSGLGGDHRAFSMAQRHFASRYRTLALDARDAGRSDRATSLYTTADMADDVAGSPGVMRVPSAHIVGQSLGGLVAEELAIRYPRVVKSLVLACT